MGVGDRSSGCLAMIFEKEYVTQPRVALEVEASVAEGPEQIFDPLFRQFGERYFVFRAFDDDLVCANSTHLIVQALAHTVEHSLDAQRWRPVRNNAGGPMAVFVLAIGENFRRRFGFIAKAEGTGTVGRWKGGGSGKVARTAGSVGG